MTAKRKKRWNCKKCRKYKRCEKLDRCIVARELKRIESPRRSGKIEIIYESEMDGSGMERFENCIYGTGKD